MYRFFERPANILEDKIILSDENIHHLRVLRIEADEEFEIVVDSLVYLVRLDQSSQDLPSVIILDKKEDDNESNIKINLYQGLPKQDKFEWIIQKATELGVTKIIPFSSSRTIVKWDEKKEKKKLVRYEEIAKSAAKQSKRSLIPEIGNQVTFKQMVNELEGKFVILAYENRGITLRQVLQENRPDEINIVIGPEGGFADYEVETFEEIDGYIVNLGNRILRTETAAIGLIAMIQYELGDIN